MWVWVNLLPFQSGISHFDCRSLNKCYLSKWLQTFNLFPEPAPTVEFDLIRLLRVNLSEFVSAHRRPERQQLYREPAGTQSRPGPRGHILHEDQGTG